MGECGLTKTDRFMSVLRKTTLALGMVLICILACCWAPRAQAAEADGLAAGTVSLDQQAKPVFSDEQYWANSPTQYGIWIYGFPENAKVTSITSSKPSVIKIKTHDGADKTNCNSYYVIVGKAGKSKVTVKYKVGSKSYSLSATYTVLNFPNAIKKLTFNGESIDVPTSKNPKNRGEVFGFTGTKGKVELELADGWEFDSLYVNTYKPKSANGDFKNFNTELGKKFTIGKGRNASISLYIHDQNYTGFNFTLSVNRNKPMELIATPLYAGFTRMAGFDTYGSDVTENAKVTKVTSSNTKVLKVKKVSGDNVYSQIQLTPVKAGKSTVNVTYKFDGKTYTTKATYQVQKNHPLKSIKVNGKTVNLKKQPYSIGYMNYKKGTISFKATASSDWKIKSIEYFDTTANKTKSMKNGASVKVPKGGTTYVNILLKSKKSNEGFGYTVYASRS